MPGSVSTTANATRIDHSDFLAQRYGAFWHHMDKNIQPPPCLSKKAKHQRLLPFSSNGGFTAPIITTGNTMRLWVEPWNSTRPIQTYTNTDGTTLIGANNSAGNADPELSLPASAQLTNYGYQNIGFSEAGFATDSRAYFLGAEIEGVAYVDRASRGTVNIIGQNEVRDIGISTITEKNINRDIGELPEDWLHDPSAVDFDVSTLAITLGGSSKIKAPFTLVPDKDQYNQKMYFNVGIVPTHTGSMKMIDNLGAGATGGSKFVIDPTRVVTYTAAFDFCDKTSGNDDGVITAVSTTGATAGEAAGRTVTMTDGTAGALPADITTYTDGKKRIVRATQQPMQSLMAGYPLMEFSCQTGQLTVQIEFKMFYQVITPKTHPNFEMAMFGAYTDVDEVSEYQLFCAAAPGYSLKSREDAILAKKMACKNRAMQSGKGGHPHLMHVLKQVEATPQKVYANYGLGKPMNEGHNWLLYVQKDSPDHDDPLPKLNRIDDANSEVATHGMGLPHHVPTRQPPPPQSRHDFYRTQGDMYADLETRSTAPSVAPTMIEY